MDVDLIRLYDHANAKYAFIPRFNNSPRAKKPKWPMPPSGDSNEINALMSKLRSKCDANATQRHRGCSASAPETETETETDTDIPPLPPNGGQAAFANSGVHTRKSEARGTP